MMTTGKINKPSWPSDTGSTAVTRSATAIPATAAHSAEIDHARAETACTLMRTSAASSGESATARMRIPRTVRCIVNSSAAIKASDVPMASRSTADRDTPSGERMVPLGSRAGRDLTCGPQIRNVTVWRTTLKPMVAMTVTKSSAPRRR